MVAENTQKVLLLQPHNVKTCLLLQPHDC